MGANNSTAVKSINNDMKSTSESIPSNAFKDVDTTIESKVNQAIVEQLKIMEKHYKLIDITNSVRKEFEQEKLSIKIEKERLQNEKENNERVLREKEMKLFEQSIIIENQKKRLEGREEFVENFLKNVISFDIDRNVNKPIKPFNHQIKLKANVENGSGVIKKRTQIPHLIRRNSSFKGLSTQHQEEHTHNLASVKGHSGLNQGLEHPVPLLSIQIPQCIKDEAAKHGRERRRTVGLSRSNTWNCGRSKQEYKCPKCERFWKSAIADAIQKCGNCGTAVLSSTPESLTHGTPFQRRSTMSKSNNTKHENTEDIYNCCE